MFKRNVEQIDLWRSGSDGYHTYRIPALALSPRTITILAFCEGRKHQRGDTGDIALLVKRSTDGGATGPASRSCGMIPGNTSGNPAPVVDQASGVVHLLMTWNRGDDHERDIISGSSTDTRRVYVTSSTDDGLTGRDRKKSPAMSSGRTGPGTRPGRAMAFRFATARTAGASSFLATISKREARTTTRISSTATTMARVGIWADARRKPR